MVALQGCETTQKKEKKEKIMTLTRSPSLGLGGILILACGFAAFLMGSGQAEERKDQGGWEKGGTYDRYYKSNELEKLRATVVAIEEIVPLPGMSPGVALKVVESEEDKDSIVIHVCPQWYMNEDSIGIKKGDRLKIRGAWAEIDGQDVFMASKIKKGEYFELKVRLTKDGTPFWGMSAEELAREKASD
jgi:hypothetical protein